MGFQLYNISLMAAIYWLDDLDGFLFIHQNIKYYAIEQDLMKLKCILWVESNFNIYAQLRYIKWFLNGNHHYSFL